MGCNRSMYLGFAVAILATISMFLSYSANFWCENISFSPSIDTTNEFFDSVDTLKFGIWYRQAFVIVDRVIGEGKVGAFVCIQYEDVVEFDSQWRTAKAFSIIGGFFGGILFIYTWLAPCLNLGGFWNAAGCLFLFVSLCQGLTLLFLNSSACNNNAIINILLRPILRPFYPDECSWEYGTRTSISAVVFWAVTGLLMVTNIIAAPQQPERPPPETQAVTYTKNADGTVSKTGVVTGTYVPGTTATIEEDDKKKAEQALEEGVVDEPAEA